jgi:hypothetical protein
MTRLHATLVALLLLLTGGLLHGTWSERWQSSNALDDAVARVYGVPLKVGDWTAQEQPSDAEMFSQAGARGYWTRSYTHLHSKQTVLVILMCGRAGRMAVHTPEVCYSSSGYELPEDPARYSLEDSSFWTALFSKPRGGAADLRLFWAWNATGNWEAPANARWAFRGRPFLYKLYVAHERTIGSPTDAAQDPAVDFLRTFLPRVEPILFPAETSVN